MDNIDDILDDVESGKTTPEDGARNIKHGDRFHCDIVRGWHKRHHSKPYLFGIYLILQGIVVLGYAVFGWFPMEFLGSWWNLVWPVMLGVMGVGMLVRAGSRGRFSFMGLVLLALGVGRMIINTGTVVMSTWWAWFWPGCLIAVGIAIVMKSLNHKSEGGIHFDWNKCDWNE
jgi:LiaF transmembrane domain